jgi:Asp/Glu/hydantoin racemase
MAEIVLINPNSSQAVTASMDACLDIVRAGTPHRLRCVTLAEAPAAIETAADIATVTPMVAAAVDAMAADAYVVACFSDPGLAEARAATPRPVIGIGEAGYLAALGLGRRFGVVSIVEASVARHAAHVARLGLGARLAGDRSLGLGVAGLHGPGAVEAIIRTGRALRDEDGADVLVLACGGMGHARAAVERALGIPVVDPVQAAAMQAAAVLTLGYPGRDRHDGDGRKGAA